VIKIGQARDERKAMHTPATMLDQMQTTEAERFFLRVLIGDNSKETEVSSQQEAIRFLQAHTKSKENVIEFRWDYQRGDDNLTLSFCYRALNKINDTLIINKCFATFTHRRKAFHPVVLANIVVPCNNLRLPSDAVRKYTTLNLSAAC